MVNLALFDKKTLNFIKKVQNKYGTRFDLNNIEYKNKETKITLFCKQHNVLFSQRPGSLLQGTISCPYCKKRQPYSLEIIKEKAFKKHGNKYKIINYDQNLKKITVQCKIGSHIFYPTINNFLKGSGCPKCSGSYKRTQEEFIQDSKKIWGKKFDYFLVKFLTMKKHIKIRCIKHDYIFTSAPDNHLNGKNSCPYCNGKLYLAGIGNVKIKKNNEINFIKKSQFKFPNKFKYNKVNFINNKTIITLICDIHDEIEIVPKTHLNSTTGCQYCSGKAHHDNLTFIRESLIKHPHIFDDYSLVDYKGNKKHITLKCLVHDKIYKIKPNDYLSGRRCKLCSFSISTGEIAVETALNQNQLKFETEYSFEDCKSEKNRKLFFDFYVSKFNLLIEYDGEHHFKPILRGSNNINRINRAKIAFKLTKQNDQIKTNYCRSRHINLLRIPYWDKHRIPELIEKKIEKIKLKHKY